MAPYRSVVYQADCEICQEIAERMFSGVYCNVQCLKHARPRFINAPLSKPSEDTKLDEFVTKDSGQRVEFSTGMKRDVQTDKPRYDLIDRVFLKRWAELMARGAQKYGENNWRKAETEEELRRFEASAIRHIFQYLEGDRTEDHAVAVAFNLAGAELVRAKLKI